MSNSKSEMFNKLQERHEELILDFLADNLTGLTIGEITKRLVKNEGYSFSDGYVRNRMSNLEGLGKAHRAGIKARAVFFRLGPEPEMAGESKVIPPKEPSIDLKEAVRMAKLEKRLDELSEKIDKVQKGMVTILARSEYSAKAMITIQAIARELGVKVDQ